MGASSSCMFSSLFRSLFEASPEEHMNLAPIRRRDTRRLAWVPCTKQLCVWGVCIVWPRYSYLMPLSFRHILATSLTFSECFPLSLSFSCSLQVTVQIFLCETP